MTSKILAVPNLTDSENIFISNKDYATSNVENQSFTDQSSIFF